VSNDRGLNFARTVNDNSDNLPKSRGDCFDYGSWYGCDCNCPQFSRGECKTANEEIEVFRKMVYKDEDCDLEEILKIYPQLRKMEV